LKSDGFKIYSVELDKRSIDYKELFTIPNDDRAIIEAKPGDYRERQSGKVIKNPDYISQWTVTGNGSKENIDNYKVIEDSKTIQIHRILHSQQNWLEIL